MKTKPKYWVCYTGGVGAYHIIISVEQPETNSSNSYSGPFDKLSEAKAQIYASCKEDLDTARGCIKEIRALRKADL